MRKEKIPIQIKHGTSAENERVKKLLLNVAQSGMHDPRLERKTSGQDIDAVIKKLDEIRKEIGDAVYKRSLVEATEVLRLSLSPGAFRSVENFVEEELERLVRN
jgi:hypothetical protein